MSEHIVFIGPPGVPLQSIASQVAERLHLPIHSPNDFSEAEWEALGWSMSADMLAWAQDGAYGSYRLNMDLRIRAIEKLMALNERYVIVLPPNYVVQEEAHHLEKLVELLAQTSSVILLVPSTDVEENALLLDVDLKGFPDFGALNAHLVEHPSNERLAKQIIYTEGKTIEETRDEILSRRSIAPPSDIILIGPKLTGKSTLGTMLADALHVPQVSLDQVGRNFLAETDYNPDAARQANRERGLFGWFDYMRPYEAHMVERVLETNHNCVIDFGAGHSYYEDETLFRQVAKALEPYANVFLILPSPDKSVSTDVLQKRFEADVVSERKLHRLLVTHPSYEALSNLTLYTKDRTPVESAGEAVSWIQGFT